MARHIVLLVDGDAALVSSAVTVLLLGLARGLRALVGTGHCDEPHSQFSLHRPVPQ
jgi:hypothetical protein